VKDVATLTATDNVTLIQKLPDHQQKYLRRRCACMRPVVRPKQRYHFGHGGPQAGKVIGHSGFARFAVDMGFPHLKLGRIDARMPVI
jgi:hypothetical protein